LYADVPPELSKVENLMKDYPFYTDNGRKFRAGQKWIVAAWAFTRAMELNPDAKTGESLEFWREAVYKAFNDPAAGTIIDLNRIRAVDPPMAGVADAQAKLAAGNILPAEKTILEVIRQSDKFPEALLVQARILARQNAGDRALQILDALRKNADLPGWIRDEIARIVDVELPKP
jgi:hypothetical protein